MSRSVTIAVLHIPARIQSRRQIVFQEYSKQFATSFHSSAAQWQDQPAASSTSKEHTTPVARYKALVEKGLLREDSYQLQIVQKLERLHENLKTYKQKVRPESETAEKAGGGGLVS
jgi:predicted ATPase